VPATIAGGRIYNYQGTVYVNGGMVYYNLAGQQGGGLFTWGNAARVTITTTYVIYNQATGAGGTGGGFFEKDGSLTLNGVTLRGNRETVGAGGAVAAAASFFNINPVPPTDPIVPVPCERGLLRQS